MNREAKSLLNSLIIILLYYFAIVGLVRLFWNTSNEYQFEGRVKFLGLLLILLTVLGVILPYHIFPMHTVDAIYYFIIFSHLSILLVGGVYYLFSKK
jgi:hypothetical protein